ncbi:hypothetical protein IEQ34_027088 [Dendrobium chrysotoxum]|uniref:LAGLIDADG homing endonuclease n=1 Tax=Dendrobium chrysotoxum TaxID=161865 RepID=A0AAV7FHV3_DENCH|nr:hypothetical protein IEQ34_027088 [Dendrobium chrysotoxum]
MSKSLALMNVKNVGLAGLNAWIVALLYTVANKPMDDTNISMQHQLERLCVINNIKRLQGFFGELSLHPSGSFTVEKCFTASNISMREAIAAELLNVQPELSMTKHGPYLLRKLDIEGQALYPFPLLIGWFRADVWGLSFHSNAAHAHSIIIVERNFIFTFIVGG